MILEIGMNWKNNLLKSLASIQAMLGWPWIDFILVAKLHLKDYCK